MACETDEHAAATQERQIPSCRLNEELAKLSLTTTTVDLHCAALGKANERRQLLLLLLLLLLSSRKSRWCSVRRDAVEPAPAPGQGSQALVTRSNAARGRLPTEEARELTLRINADMYEGMRTEPVYSPTRVRFEKTGILGLLALSLRSLYEPPNTKEWAWRR
jgi:hypothetical protein